MQERNYDGCNEDLDELIEILNIKRSFGFEYTKVNNQIYMISCRKVTGIITNKKEGNF